MAEMDENKTRELILEILYMERKNLRNKAKTDQRMSEEIQKTIIQFSKLMH